MTLTNKFDPSSPLPHKQAFFPLKGTYFNAGVQHPISRDCVSAAQHYLKYKGFHAQSDYDAIDMRKKTLTQFAKLINAHPHEVSYVPSTTSGENLIVQALELVKKGARVVTDDLHYFGSYQIYGELKKQGVEVVTIRNNNGKIDIEDYQAAITDNTTLVAVSSVTTFNGYQADLKNICKIAHEKGALVYADAIHHIGATPFDVRDSGVDFCCCGTYKWLMADQGLGFIYVRADRLDSIKRPWYGKRQVRNLVTHVFPGDEITDDDLIYEYDLEKSTEGYFSIWSEPRIIIAQLHSSLQYLLDTGVARITDYRQAMLRKLHEEVPKLRFKTLTDKDSITPIFAFVCDNATERLSPVFKEANIYASIYKGHCRVALSVYNDLDDVELLINALKKVI